MEDDPRLAPNREGGDMTEAHEVIARLTDAWQERQNDSEWPIIADAYLDLGDEKNAALWRRRATWWNNLRIALWWTLGAKVGHGVSTPLTPLYVNFRLCKWSVYVDVNDADGTILHVPEYRRHKRYWNFRNQDARYLSVKLMDLMLALEAHIDPTRSKRVQTNQGERT